MIWLVTKYAITAFMVVLISEVAKRSDRLGGLLAALPLVTLLVLIWMKLEGQAQEKIAAHAWYTFWYVVPTLPMFILFPFIYPRAGFWLTLLIACAITVLLFALWAILLKRFGIILL
ncbi:MULTISPECIES: DUF3147 family protein [Pantoea]|uniref:DUF3147 family protein n=1 Tax=Pantoea TaxID=53335 RepID=UPI000614B500|nr:MULTISPECIES: DUF3147 family protein [Pantoea]KAA5974303.1 DUF3147 family protein [Pantoea sp. M_6]KAA5978433.1 DUF3147 family protein [Pantoea sp. M_8]KAA5989809.1 DUF3147 family protein [Pantoea sp. M_10]KAA6002962.1 DUF3147 family protein [Pantoea sp. M_5]KKB02948.1 hypothetical protein TN98_18240 [Pantoea anthophila]